MYTQFCRCETFENNNICKILLEKEDMLLYIPVKEWERKDSKSYWMKTQIERFNIYSSRKGMVNFWGMIRIFNVLTNTIILQDACYCILHNLYISPHSFVVKSVSVTDI